MFRLPFEVVIVRRPFFPRLATRAHLSFSKSCCNTGAAELLVVKGIIVEVADAAQ